MNYKKMLVQILFIFCALVIMTSTVTCVQAYMVVHDANGQFIGFGDPISDAIYIPSLEALVTFRIREDIYDSQNPTAYYGDIMQRTLLSSSGLVFESNDCSGIPYYYSDNNFSMRSISKDKDNPGYLIMFDFNNMRRLIPKSIKSTSSCRLLTDSDVVGFEKYKQNSTPLHYVPIVSFQGTFPFELPVALPFQYKQINSMDVNGDGKTGLVEAIYSLQKTVGSR